MDRYFELVTTICLSEDVHFTEMHEKLASFVSKAMLNDPELKELHQKNTFKFFIFSLPFPAEKEGIYKSNHLYYFILRSIDIKLIMKMKRYFSQTKDDIRVISSEIKQQSYRFINEISTVTASVAIFNKRCWVKENGIETIMQRIHNNVVRKMKAIDSSFEEPKENFISTIEIINHKPLNIKYKKIKLLGNKFRIVVKSDSVSQQCAFMALACGILEKGSLGCGYCVAK